jgi:hypothetical protein
MSWLTGPQDDSTIQATEIASILDVILCLFGDARSMPGRMLKAHWQNGYVPNWQNGYVPSITERPVLDRNRRSHRRMPLIAKTGRH